MLINTNKSPAAASPRGAIGHVSKNNKDARCRASRNGEEQAKRRQTTIKDRKAGLRSNEEHIRGMHAMKPALRRVSYSLRLKRSFSSVIGTASSPSNAPPSSSSLKKEEQFDVVVTGGGPVVIAFILSLLKKSEGNLKVALINREHPKAVAGATTEHKICVISPHSKMFLEELGAWSYVEESAHSFDRMQISDSKSPGYLKFHASELNMQELGFICKESTIEESLHKVIEASQYKLSILQDYSMDKIIFPSDHIKDEASSSSSSNMLSIAMTSDGVPISNKTIHTK